MPALFGEQIVREREKEKMIDRNMIVKTASMLLAGVLASGILILPVAAQSSAPAAKSSVTAASTRYKPDRFAGRAGTYYRLVWGIESPSVKWAESGEMIRFSYNVLDAEKAKALNDKKNEPSLIDPQAGVSLVVPALEQVGQLRQSATPKAGVSYWMAFSNSGRRVKRGDRVNVVIGQFRANGLVVE
jgi:hypothetical protein